jgi:phage/plasmid-like protein (TIGR03299 family)
MAHQFVEGFFSNNEPAWHGLGKVLPAGYWPGKAEAMKLAGHDWKVVERPVYSESNGVRIDMDGFKALFNDRGETLTVVNKTYEVIQNDVPYDLVEAVSKEGIKWHCGITLQSGKCVVVGYLPEAWTAPKDSGPTFPFLTALWSHDGTSALKLIRTAIRVVCANTKAMAEAEAGRTGLEISIRHTKNWRNYVEDARNAMKNLRQGWEEYKELTTELAKRTIITAQVDDFLKAFLPMPDLAGVEYSKRVENNVLEAREATRKVLNGPTIPEAHRRTAYGLWQAGLEYLQHVRPTRKAHSKFNRSVLAEDKTAANLHRLVLSVTR